MSFLFPMFLSAFALVLIPILIHLFYFKRYKKMDFTLVHFLKSIQEKNQSQKQLKNFLILLSRICFIICLVLAFAQPFFSKNKKLSQQGVVVLFLDNSLSLSSTDGDKRFQNLKSLAHELVDQFPDRDFMVVNHQFTELAKNIYDANAVHREIDQMKLVGSHVDYPTLKAFVQTKSSISELFILSDFQKSFKLNNALKSKSYQEYWLPFKSEVLSNVYIDSVWLEAPFIDQSSPIHILCKLKRNDPSFEWIQKVNLHLNDENRGFVNVDFKDHEAVIDTIKLQLNEAGNYKGVLSIEDDGLQFDNVYYFNLNVADQIKILIVKDKVNVKAVSKLFKQFNYFKADTVSINQLDYSNLSNYDLVVLHGLENISTGLISAMQNRLQQGKDMVIIPSSNMDLIQYNNLYKSLSLIPVKTKIEAEGAIHNLNFQSSLFQSVFEEVEVNSVRYPKLNWYYILSTSNAIFPELIIENRNHALLNRYKAEDANIYQFLFAWDKENKAFSDHAIFPPLWYNIVLESKHIGSINYQLGKEMYLDAPNLGLTHGKSLMLQSEDQRQWLVKMRKVDGRNRLKVDESVENAGFYDLYEGDKKLETYAFNVDRNESLLDFYSDTELADWAQEIKVEMIEVDGSEKIESIIDSSNSMLWKLCIILAILFLMLEIGFIKFL